MGIYIPLQETYCTLVLKFQLFSITQRHQSRPMLDMVLKYLNTHVKGRILVINLVPYHSAESAQCQVWLIYRQFQVCACGQILVIQQRSADSVPGLAYIFLSMRFQSDSSYSAALSRLPGLAIQFLACACSRSDSSYSASLSKLSARFGLYKYSFKHALLVGFQLFSIDH